MKMTGLQPSDADNRKTGVPIAPERTLPRRDKRRHDDDDNPFGTISQSDIVFFDFPQTFSSPCWLRIMLHVRFSLLKYAQRS